MNYFFINLKRFDVPNEVGGVNYSNDMQQWGKQIVSSLNELVAPILDEETTVGLFLPELHLLSAIEVAEPWLHIGAQSVYEKDVVAGENFGAMTTHRSAKAMKYAGCNYALIGHIEERRSINEVLALASVHNPKITNGVLQKRIVAAQTAGLKVVYCIGESESEQSNWQEVLNRQLEIGLNGVDMSSIVIAYEPIWAIGPGKMLPEKDYIEKVAAFIKEKTNGLPVIYGGGLKTANAQMIASCINVDGGLIALTRFEGNIGFYPENVPDIITLYRAGVNENENSI